METIKYYIEKYKLVLLLSIIILILLLIIIRQAVKPEKTIKVESVKLNNKIKEEKKDYIQKVKVDIKGYIKEPGVYELDSNSRVIDVINRAGGLLEDSNTEYINLSKKIVDEMIIIIYSNSEVEKFKQTDKEIIYIEYKCVCPDNKNDACINTDDVVNTNGIKKDKIVENNSSNKISINTATLEEFMTLSGIGESKAKSIIEYRQSNGNFEKLEDIMNVSGIGESAYSKIKDSITL